MAGPFWAGFANALGQGLQTGQENKRKKEELGLRKQQLQYQLKQMDLEGKLKEHQLREAMTKAGSIEQLAQQFAGPGTEPPVGAEGPRLPSGSFFSNPGGDPLRAAAARVNPAEAAKQIFQPAPKSLIEQLQEWQMFQQGLGQGGTQGGSPQISAAPLHLYPKANAKGQLSLGARPEQQAQGADSRMFQDLIRKHGGNIEAARAEYNQAIGQTAASRAGGMVQGTLAEQSKPEFLATETAKAEARSKGEPIPVGQAKEIGSLEAALRQIEIAGKNFDPKFLGPFQGTELGYSVRRRVGNYVGDKVSGAEADFRGGLARAREQLIRAYEGAVISEPMYRRLLAMMPDPTSELQVFLADYDRFKTELGNSIKTSRGLIQTPRGQLGGSSLGGQGRLVPIPGAR